MRNLLVGLVCFYRQNNLDLVRITSQSLAPRSRHPWDFKHRLVVRDLPRNPWASLDCKTNGAITAIAAAVIAGPTLGFLAENQNKGKLPSSHAPPYMPAILLNVGILANDRAYRFFFMSTIAKDAATFGLSDVILSLCKGYFVVPSSHKAGSANNLSKLIILFHLGHILRVQQSKNTMLYGARGFWPQNMWHSHYYHK